MPVILCWNSGRASTAVMNRSWSSSTPSSNAMSVTRMVPSSRSAPSSLKIGTSWIGPDLYASRLRWPS